MAVISQISRSYEIQTVRGLRLNTGKDVSAGTLFKIRYVSPYGRKGTFNAVLETNNRILKYIADPVDIDELGTWVFNTLVEYEDGRTEEGRLFEVEIINKIIQI